MLLAVFSPVLLGSVALPDAVTPIEPATGFDMSVWSAVGTSARRRGTLVFTDTVSASSGLCSLPFEFAVWRSLLAPYAVGLVPGSEELEMT